MLCQAHKQIRQHYKVVIIKMLSLHPSMETMIMKKQLHMTIMMSRKHRHSSLWKPQAIYSQPLIRYTITPGTAGCNPEKHQKRYLFCFSLLVFLWKIIKVYLLVYLGIHFEYIFLKAQEVFLYVLPKETPKYTQYVFLIGVSYKCF